MSSTERLALQRSAFPGGVPRLWCPILTHFRAARDPDADRISQHLSELSPFVKGILVPGSTGEGWEMDDGDVRRLLNIVLPAAETFGVKVLLGILKTDVNQVLAALDGLEDCCKHPAVVGVTVCPPRGAELSQLEIADALRQVLSRGLATALYQLPQVTLNEMHPETVAKLAAEFPNFLLFKDTSGLDKVAQSGLDFGGVNFVRGSEQGGYAKWIRTAGGPYDGFLLSTANVLAPELSRLLHLTDLGDLQGAEELSLELEGLVSSIFGIVKNSPVGNAFANANKVMYHLRSHGQSVSTMPAPMLYCGERLPSEFIDRALELVSNKYRWLLEQ
jgi:dihydrodipicolinate synthase/N-acetylneuraminate lyase